MSEITKTVENVENLFDDIVLNGTSLKSSNDETIPEDNPSSTSVDNETEETTIGTPIHTVVLNGTEHNVKDLQANSDITVLDGDILAEASNRESEDNNLYQHITQEQTNRANADSDLQEQINTLQSTINDLQTQLNALKALVPPQATDTNQLSDKAFVNSSVQTATANFRGSWESWADVPSVSSLYPEDFGGSKIPTVNDYIAVQEASGFGADYEGTWRFKYTGDWATNGKNGWIPEYKVNETPLTEQQLASLNSGITAESVATIAQNTADISQNTDAIATKMNIANFSLSGTTLTITIPSD